MPCLFHPFFQSVCYPFAIPSFCYPFLVFDFVCYLADYILVFLPFEKKSDLGFHSLLRYPLWYLSVFNINCKPFVDLFPFCPAGLSGCCTISRCTLLYYILLCTVVLYLSVHCCTISYCTLLYYILLYTAVLYLYCFTISHCTWSSILQYYAVMSSFGKSYIFSILYKYIQGSYSVQNCIIPSAVRLNCTVQYTWVVYGLNWTIIKLTATPFKNHFFYLCSPMKFILTFYF